MIIKQKHLKSTLFIDIETVSTKSSFEELNVDMQAHWSRKSIKFLKDRDSELTPALVSEFYQQKAGIFAEFAKVACITVGYITSAKGEKSELRLKSFSGEEKDILVQFNEMLDRHYDRPDEHFLCGHNIKEFDIPFLCRRCIINGLDLPRLMNIAGKKPWQVEHLLDTMDLWRFGDYKNYTSLALLASTLDIPSPKDDIDGSRVGHVFWKENDIGRIISYCEKDVLTVVQIVMKFAGLEPIAPENVIVTNEDQ